MNSSSPPEGRFAIENERTSSVPGIVMSNVLAGLELELRSAQHQTLDVVGQRLDSLDAHRLGLQRNPAAQYLLVVVDAA